MGKSQKDMCSLNPLLQYTDNSSTWDTSKLFSVGTEDDLEDFKANLRAKLPKPQGPIIRETEGILDKMEQKHISDQVSFWNVF